VIYFLLGKNIFKKSKHQHSNKSFWMNYYFLLVKGDKKITTFHFLFGFLSASWRNKDVVRLLLREGANTKLGNNHGKPACTWNNRVGNIIPGC
jgi:hypothetical protein